MLNTVEDKQQVLKLIAWCWINNPGWIVEACSLAFKLKAPQGAKVH